jgi:hypothetical protein
MQKNIHGPQPLKGFNQMIVFLVELTANDFSLFLQMSIMINLYDFLSLYDNMQVFYDKI